MILVVGRGVFKVVTVAIGHDVGRAHVAPHSLSEQVFDRFGAGEVRLQM